MSEPARNRLRPGVPHEDRQRAYFFGSVAPIVGVVNVSRRHLFSPLPLKINSGNEQGFPPNEEMYQRVRDAGMCVT
jgi:hypothetical protein